MERSICSEMVQLKKGTWTAEEDRKLVAYIKEHGHVNWRTLPTKAGLRRCGKSCRLRWTNYLKPDIKRGKFTLHEQQTIVRLHALVGNRWSTIASHLPKRTDNEIKNLWNTHLVKRLTKLGIDPITHKPKTEAMGSPDQSKDATNLSHTAQWESARLEAEARIVKEKELSRNTHCKLNQLGSIASRPASTRYYQAAMSSSASKPLPYIDVLKVWQSNSPQATASLINSFFTSSTSKMLESPTSTLNFSENTFNVPNCVAFIQNSTTRALADVGIAKVDDQNNFKDLANLTMELQEVFPNQSTCIVDNFTDHLAYEIDHGLQNSYGESQEVVDGIDNYNSECQEHRNYWDSILNFVTLQSEVDQTLQKNEHLQHIDNLVRNCD